MAIDFSKYYNKISNSGHDERGKYHEGKAGDQTGGEWSIINWYNRPWNYVFRYPDQKTRELIAELSIQAANNNNIGYDQWERETYWSQLKKVGYRPSKITTPCEADCSAGVIANIKAVGYLLGNKKLQNLNASYTGDMRQGLKQAGFQVLTDSKYLKNSAYLMPGDILLYENHHTATNLGIGSKVNYTPSKEDKPVESKVGKNETSTATKQIQTMLNKVGNYALKVDNSYGQLTTAAVKDFQTKNKLPVTGNVDETTLTKLKSLSKAADKINLVVPINTTGNYNNTPKFNGTVTTLLNIRKQPKVGNNNLISYPTLPANYKVKICDAMRDSAGTVWYFIQIDGDKGIKYGFANANYIKVTSRI